MKLSILIPCFNEEKTIKVLLEKVIENLNKNDEIIIIDDFSTDKTRKILSSHFENSVYKIIYNEKNYGKGFSIRQGIKARRTRNEGRVRKLMKLRDEYAARRQRTGYMTLHRHESVKSGKQVFVVEDLTIAYDHPVVSNFSTIGPCVKKFDLRTLLTALRSLLSIHCFEYGIIN